MAQSDIPGRTADSARRYAQDAYERSSRYVQRQRERHPEAERYIGYGTGAVRRPVNQNPILSVLVAGAVGYCLAYLIHGAGRRGGAGVPEYARSETRYRWD
ncbi:hypothetical protein [Salinarimonas sp.]|uniref:hypothetical protein n=1 Tax=Salinarimonas sp. TaxID=2766526 RepID=UPI0032D9302C